MVVNVYCSVLRYKTSIEREHEAVPGKVMSHTAAESIIDDVRGCEERFGSRTFQL